MKVGDKIHGYELTQKIERGGSDREFFRCSKDNTSFILIYDTDILYYLKLHRHLAERGIAVPEVYWFDTEKSVMVQEDLGPNSLYEMSIAGTRQPVIYKQAIDELIRLQVEGIRGAPLDLLYDSEHIRWEQEYFRNCFLIQYCRIEKEVSHKIDMDLQNISSNILQSAEPIGEYLMHRDFQSQNIYYKNKRIRIIDFQSARIGPLTYDLGALLRDAYVEIDQNTERELFDYYHAEIQKKRVNITRNALWQVYRLTALQRGMQALGAFSNLYLNKNKTRFLQYMPRGIRLLKQGAQDCGYNNLYSMLSSLNTSNYDFQ
jgi:aminoglycoside/choline kinase family phosphotransferase